MTRSNRTRRDLFGQRVVNVASVPHRSPFRYPGGKTWFVPHVRRWLQCRGSVPGVFIEPFAGGAIVGLTVAFENLANSVLLVERDEEVAAVWQTILGEHNEWLARRIELFVVSEENVRCVVASDPATVREKAFRTIVKNRTFHGGILAPGSAPIRSGENGKGIGSRWYAQTLARRIRDIASVSSKVRFVSGDGINVIRENSEDESAVFFVDPPYTAAGKCAGRRLYKYHEIDHSELFDVLSGVSGDFIMTYNNDDEILRMAKHRRFETHSVPMKNTHHSVMNELIVGRDLSWTF